MPADIVKVLERQGISTPSPIQAASLSDSIDGSDVLGRGRTGSGKTLAFLIPLVVGLDETRNVARPKRPRALVLAPTRELAIQIDEALAPLAKVYGLTSRTIFGGVNQNPQVTALRKGVDIVVACPGRLEDLMGQGHADLSDIEITVIDEADHMADLGFLPGVTRILRATPRDTQRLLFSATLDNAVKGLVKEFMNDPVVHEADSAQSPVAKMDHHVLHVTDADHMDVLTDLVAGAGRTVVFTRTKHRAKRLAKKLNAAGVPSVELHGNLAQNARTRNMDAFHSGDATVLVATDIAARGIHVDHVGLVVHADPPVEHKAYLHRSGRTARAGEEGTVVTLMTEAQRRDVRDLTRKAGIKPTVTKVTPTSGFLTDLVPGERTFPGAWESPAAQQPSGRGGRTGGRSAQGGRPRRGAPRATGNTSSEKGAAPASGRNAGSRTSRTGAGPVKSRPARASDGQRSGGAPASSRGERRRGGRNQTGSARS